MARRAGDLHPTVVEIEDEFSNLSDEDRSAVLEAWFAELDAHESIDVPISAAETLGELRESGEV
jgi:hypothetical protein